MSSGWIRPMKSHDVKKLYNQRLEEELQISLLNDRRRAARMEEERKNERARNRAAKNRETEKNKRKENKKKGSAVPRKEGQGSIEGFVFTKRVSTPKTETAILNASDNVTDVFTQSLITTETNRVAKRPYHTAGNKTLMSGKDHAAVHREAERVLSSASRFRPHDSRPSTSRAVNKEKEVTLRHQALVATTSDMVLVGGGEDEFGDEWADQNEQELVRLTDCATRL